MSAIPPRRSCCSAWGTSVLALPTVLLSNRPGYKAIAGERIDPAKLDAMLEAAAEQWLACRRGRDPDRLHPHARSTRRFASMDGTVRRSNPMRFMFAIRSSATSRAGYTSPREAAQAIREKLVPLADMLTPNLFELGWLAGWTVARCRGGRGCRAVARRARR